MRNPHHQTTKGERPEAGRSSTRRRPVGVDQLVVAVVLGLVAASGAIAWVHHQRAAAAATDPLTAVAGFDRVEEALAGVRADGVYVAPDGRSMVDAAGERAIEQAVRDQEIPVYVVVWAPGYQLGASPYDVRDALQRELDGEDGFLYVWEGAEQGAVLDLGPRGGTPQGVGSEFDFVGDPATTLVDAVSAVSEDDFYGDPGEDAGEDYWGGLDGGSWLGLLLGSAIVGAVLLVSKLLARACGRRRLLPGGWSVQAPEDQA